MTGVIIAGGAGVRLRPLTYVRPKPMMPIANKPLLEYQVDLLRINQITDTVFCLVSGMDQITNHFGDGSRFGTRITYSVEDTPLGTGGAVRLSEPYWKHDFAVVMNGDGLIDYDLSAIIRFHQESRADATIGLIQVPTPTHCGIVRTDDNGRIISFDEPDEKAKKLNIGHEGESTGTATVNGGVYVISRAAINSIPHGTACSIEKEFFPALIKSKKKVYGFALQGYWKDIGSPVKYLEAHHDLLAGKIDAHIPGTLTDEGYWKIRDVRIDASARIAAGSHLGAGCTIGAHADIGGFTTIGPGCTIGEDSVLDGCVLLEDVNVSHGCVLRDCIIDRNSIIGDGIRLIGRSVIGANTILIAPGTTDEQIMEIDI